MKSNTVKVAAALGSKQKDVLEALDGSKFRTGGYGSGWFCEPSEAATITVLRALSKFYSIKDFGDKADRTVKVVETDQGRFEMRERLNPRSTFKLYENADGVEYEIEEPEEEEVESPSLATDSVVTEEVAAPAQNGRKGKRNNVIHDVVYAAIANGSGEPYVGRFVRGTQTHAIVFTGKVSECVKYAGLMNKDRGVEPLQVSDVLDSIPGLGVS